SAHQIGGSRLRLRPGHVSGQLHQDDGSYRRSTLNPYVTAVIVNDLAGDCQSQAGAVVLRRANKRLKQVLTNRLRYAGAVVPNAHFEGVRVAAYGHAHRSTGVLGGLARVEQQIEKCALQLTRIEHAGGGTVSADLNRTPAKLRTGTNCIRSATYYVLQLRLS